MANNKRQKSNKINGVRKRLEFAISLIVGIVVFIFVLDYFGIDSLKVVYSNIQPIYFIPYILFTIFAFVAISWRLQVVLGAYNEKTSFWKLFTQSIAGYTISYLTPSARIGGEPLKVYMMKKECGIDYKTGSSAVIMDKFIELFGSAGLGIAGLILLFFLPGIPLSWKVILGLVMVVSVLFLLFIYYWTVKGGGPFTYIFNLLRFYKFSKFKKFSGLLKDVEQKMYNFFVSHKKEFFWGCVLYGLYGLTTFFEFKFLFLSLGFDATIIELILTIVTIGMINFVPVPAGFGFHEAGQSGLLSVMRGSGEIGLAFILIARLRALVTVAVGFIIISHFGGKKLLDKVKESKLSVEDFEKNGRG
ncbi:flippase-like domain-containing protein [Candidatus Pacearchaeota archaeon]|nr:flippase-like domain-containing protein [Candidatus Pacearchaeota archaeon]